MDLKASQAIRRKHAQQQITTAYHNKLAIPGVEQSFTFGTPLTDWLLQPTSLLNAWLLQYQARQHWLANQGWVDKKFLEYIKANLILHLCSRSTVL